MPFDRRDKLRVALLVAAALIAGGWLHHVWAKERDQSATDLPDAELEPTLASPDAQLSSSEDARRLKRDLELLTAQVNSLRAQMRIQGTPASLEPPSAADALPVLKSDAETRAEWAAHMAEVEAAFNEERVDPSWARETDAALRSQLSSHPELGAAALSLECRSQRCRLELQDRGAPSFSQELPLLAHEMGSTLPDVAFETVDQGDGKSLRILYFSRAAPRAERAQDDGP